MRNDQCYCSKQCREQGASIVRMTSDFLDDDLGHNTNNDDNHYSIDAARAVWDRVVRITSNFSVKSFVKTASNLSTQFISVLNKTNSFTTRNSNTSYSIISSSIKLLNPLTKKYLLFDHSPSPNSQP
jgi:hypothetical protein